MLARALAVLWIFRGARRRRGRGLLTIGALLLGAGGCGMTGQLVGQAAKLVDGSGVDHVQLVRVSDGDTIVVRYAGKDRRVRLGGVDAPESSGTRYGSASCGGRQAKAYLVRLLYRRPVDRDGDGLADAGTGARAITLIGDRAFGDDDAYGRLLRYVKVRGQRRTVQERLLEAGWAKVYVFDAAFDRLDRFRAAQRKAKDRGVGAYRRCGGNFNTAAR